MKRHETPKRNDPAPAESGAPATLQGDTGTATPATPVAPATPQGETEEEPSKRAVAKHHLLDASGAVVEDEEAATGYRYTLLANGQTFEWQSGLQPGGAVTMLAIFGAKTLATNETSQARNNAKGSASADEQIAAVRERFDLLATGKWVDRTREGVGARVDKDALAEAIVQVQVAAGSKLKSDTAYGKAGEVITDAMAAAGHKAAVRQKLEDDPAFVKTARAVPQVATVYAQLVGRQTKTVDDLAV